MHVDSSEREREREREIETETETERETADMGGRETIIAGASPHGGKRECAEWRGCPGGGLGCPCVILGEKAEKAGQVTGV